MYLFLHDLLSDKKGGEIFTLFGFWHFFYIAFTLLTIIALLALIKRKGEVTDQVTGLLIRMAFALYILDFFLMPLAYGQIDIEKLPFHGCTAMCVMCFLSHHVAFLKKYRASFTLLGFITNLVYLIYPAGVMWHGVHPLSYRVIQTLLFHSVMTVYGAVCLALDRNQSMKNIGRDLTVILCMILWAMLGNYIYNGTTEGYSHFFNWFFVVRDPFYIIPAKTAPYIMPVLNFLLFSAVSLIVRLAVCNRRKSQASVCS